VATSRMPAMRVPEPAPPPRGHADSRRLAEIQHSMEDLLLRPPGPRTSTPCQDHPPTDSFISVGKAGGGGAGAGAEHRMAGRQELQPGQDQLAASLARLLAGPEEEVAPAPARGPVIMSPGRHQPRPGPATPRPNVIRRSLTPADRAARPGPLPARNLLQASEHSAFAPPTTYRPSATSQPAAFRFPPLPVAAAGGRRGPAAVTTTSPALHRHRHQGPAPAPGPGPDPWLQSLHHGLDRILLPGVRPG
jgi:hypothetical protein